MRDYTEEDLNRLVCEWERTKKQRECDHEWDQVSYIQTGLQTIRIFCTKCKFHIERKERRVIKWGPWSRLPNIGPKYKQYVDSQRPRIRSRKNSVTRVTDK